MPHTTDLDGRVALVTGAGTGIGRAVALALAGAGATVGIHYHISQTGAEETLASLTELGAKGVLLAGDLTVEEQACGIVDRLIAEAGRLDILVNNAGSVVQRSRIEDCPTELWRRAFDVNVNSAFFVIRQAIPHLRRSGHGSIVNNLTLSVQTGGAGGAGPYAAAKGALQVMTRTLARELISPRRAGKRHNAWRYRDAPPRGVQHARTHGRVPATNTSSLNCAPYSGTKSLPAHPSCS
jgi:3-oxoacyl-[acyl-carrier protein] reductase